MIPTAVVIYFVVCTGNTQTWETYIQNKVGLRAIIGSARTPVPNVVELKDLVLRDFTRGQLLGLDKVTLARVGNTQRVIVSDVQVKSADLPLLIQRFGAIFNHSRSKLSTIVQFKQIILIPEQKGQGFVRLFNGQLKSTVNDDTPSLAFDFSLAPEEKKQCELTMSLSRVNGKPFTRLILKTNAASIPCWIMSAWDDSFNLLGNEATFTGEAIGGVSRTQQFTRLQGKIEHVDMTQLITNNLPHKLDGVATILLNDCLINQQGIQSMEGRLVSTALPSSRNEVSLSLLSKAQEHLGMNARTNSFTTAPIQYGKIQFDFSLGKNSDSIKLWGTCDPDGQGIAMVDHQGSPILQTVEQKLPVANLIRTFLPDGSQQAITNKGCRQVLALFPQASQLR